MSRIVNRDFVLHRDQKDQFTLLMRRYEAFSQVTVRTHCVMTNHFHILVDIPAPPEDGGASWSDEKLLKHLETIYGETKLGEIRWELGHYRMALFEEGEERVRDEVKNRAGIPRARVEKVLARGGTLSEAELMWCRTRYFVDGLVIGSEAFVDLSPPSG